MSPDLTGKLTGHRHLLWTLHGQRRAEPLQLQMTQAGAGSGVPYRLSTAPLQRHKKSRPIVGLDALSLAVLPGLQVVNGCVLLPEDPAELIQLRAGQRVQPEERVHQELRQHPFYAPFYADLQQELSGHLLRLQEVGYTASFSQHVSLKLNLAAPRPLAAADQGQLCTLYGSSPERSLLVLHVNALGVIGGIEVYEARGRAAERMSLSRTPGVVTTLMMSGSLPQAQTEWNRLVMTPGLDHLVQGLLGLCDGPGVYRIPLWSSLLP